MTSAGDLKSELAAVWKLVEADRKALQDYFLIGMIEYKEPRKMGEGKYALAYNRGVVAAQDAVKHGRTRANNNYYNPKFQLDDRIPSEIYLDWTKSNCIDLAIHLWLQTDDHFKAYAKIFNEQYIEKLKELVSRL